MDWSYLAGFTDGDGSIHFQNCRRGCRVYRRACISWSQKASESGVLKAIASFLRSHGIPVTSGHWNTAWRGHKYPQRSIVIRAQQDVRYIAMQLLPHLITKRKAAVAALAFVNERLAARRAA
jgi:hypothetical protein